MRGARREVSHLVRMEEAGEGLGAVFDAGNTASSSSESQQGLLKVLIKLKLPIAGCLASTERVHRAPSMPCLLVICSNCTISFPSVPLFEMDQVS